MNEIIKKLKDKLGEIVKVRDKNNLNKIGFAFCVGDLEKNNHSPSYDFVTMHINERIRTEEINSHEEELIDRTFFEGFRAYQELIMYNSEEDCFELGGHRNEWDRIKQAEKYLEIKKLWDNRRIEK